MDSSSIRLHDLYSSSSLSVDVGLIYFIESQHGNTNTRGKPQASQITIQAQRGGAQPLQFTVGSPYLGFTIMVVLASLLIAQPNSFGHVASLRIQGTTQAISGRARIEGQSSTHSTATANLEAPQNSAPSTSIPSCGASSGQGRSYLGPLSAAPPPPPHVIQHWGHLRPRGSRSKLPRPLVNSSPLPPPHMIQHCRHPRGSRSKLPRTLISGSPPTPHPPTTTTPRVIQHCGHLLHLRNRSRVIKIPTPTNFLHTIKLLSRNLSSGCQYSCGHMYNMLGE